MIRKDKTRKVRTRKMRRGGGNCTSGSQRCKTPRVKSQNEILIEQLIENFKNIDYNHEDEITFRDYRDSVLENRTVIQENDIERIAEKLSGKTLEELITIIDIQATKDTEIIDDEDNLIYSTVNNNNLQFQYLIDGDIVPGNLIDRIFNLKKAGLKGKRNFLLKYITRKRKMIERLYLQELLT